MPITTKVKLWRLAAIAWALLALLLIPIRTRVLPEVQVIVQDRSGRSVPGAIVREVWGYRLADQASYEASAPSDSSGTVHFPIRSITASVLERAIALVQEWARADYHRTQAPYGSISVWAPGYQTVARAAKDIHTDTVRIVLPRDPAWNCPQPAS